MMRSLAALGAALLLLGACAPLHPQPAPPAAAPAKPRRIAGVLNGRTVLSGQVKLAADVLVPRGAELVIRAGTTVHVHVTESSKIEPQYLSAATELLVRGRLRVEGTAARPVRFVPDGQGVDGGRPWAGIELDGARRSEIRGTRIAGAETGILCIRTSPLLRGNHLTGCRYGIIVQGGAPQILGNQVERGEGGIFCWRGARPALRGNRISGNQEEGVFVDATSSPQLADNTISGNGIGLAWYPPGLRFDPARIRGNRVNLRRLLSRKGAR